MTANSLDANAYADVNSNLKDMADSMKAFGAMMSKMASQTKASMGQMADKFESMGKTTDSLRENFGKLGETLQELNKNLSAGGTVLGIPVDVIGRAADFIGIAAGIITFITAAIAIGPLLVPLLSNPLTWVVAAVFALASALTYVTIKIIDNWDQIVESFSNGFQKIENFGNSIAYFSKLLANLGVEKLQQQLDSIMAAFADAYERLKPYIELFRKLISKIINFVTGKAGKVTEAFDKGIIQGIYALFEEFSPVTFVRDALDEITKYITGYDLKTVITNKLKDLANLIPKNIKSLFGFGNDDEKSTERYSPARPNISSNARSLRSREQATHGLVSFMNPKPAKSQVSINLSGVPKGMTAEVTSKSGNLELPIAVGSN